MRVILSTFCGETTTPHNEKSLDLSQGFKEFLLVVTSLKSGRNPYSPINILVISVLDAGNRNVVHHLLVANKQFKRNKQSQYKQTSQNFF